MGHYTADGGLLPAPRDNFLHVCPETSQNDRFSFTMTEQGDMAYSLVKALF